MSSPIDYTRDPLVGPPQSTHTRFNTPHPGALVSPIVQTTSSEEDEDYSLVPPLYISKTEYNPTFDPLPCPHSRSKGPKCKPMEVVPLYSARIVSPMASSYLVLQRRREWMVAEDTTFDACFNVEDAR
jgi:hypothetical protein